MTTAAWFEDDVLASTTLTVDSGEEPFVVPVEELDPVSLRQAALAVLSQKSLVATDITALALEAAQFSARVCGADSFSFATRAGLSSTSHHV